MKIEDVMRSEADFLNLFKREETQKPVRRKAGTILWYHFPKLYDKGYRYTSYKELRQGVLNLFNEFLLIDRKACRDEQVEYVLLAMELERRIMMHINYLPEFIVTDVRDERFMTYMVVMIRKMFMGVEW